MLIGASKGKVMLIECDKVQRETIKAWPEISWNRKKKWWEGFISLTLLNNMREFFDAQNPAKRLPYQLEVERKRLEEIQAAVDAERMKPEDELKPLASYPVKTKMYSHQIRGANMTALIFGWARLHGNAETDDARPLKRGCGFGYLFEMGAGKTLTTIAIMGLGYQSGKVKRVLVIAPTSVVAVWPSELERFADFEYTCKPLMGAKQKRLKALDDIQTEFLPGLKVVATNYENTWREGMFEALQKFDADLVVCDESQRIKNHKAEQSKAIHILGDRARYKLILSGTPVQNNAIDLFSQYRFLDRSVFGDSYWRFKNRYAVMGGFNNKQIVGYQNMDELVKKEHSIAYRVTKSEALDLPEQVFTRVVVELSPKERKVYDQLKRDSFAELESGGEVTATTVLTKILRLQQLVGGFLVEDDAEEPRQVSDAKLKALKDILIDYVLEARKKLVIFATYLPEVHAIIALSNKVLGGAGLRTVAIYGAVKKEDRGPIIEQFQTDEKTAVIIGQIDTLGTGVTLHAADTCVYYSKTYNYATYEQSLSRIHRIGQRNTCTYIDIVARDTVDTKIGDALQKKENLARTVVNDWRAYFS